MRPSLTSSRTPTDVHAQGKDNDSPSETGPGVAADRRDPQSADRTSHRVPYRLDRLGWIGVGLLLLQGVAMLGWSTLLWHRFALGGFDYGIYHQAWWLIAHGYRVPFDTVLGFAFWRNNFELIMWPLALLGVVWPHGPSLLWLQDASLVGAELVAWRWMREATVARAGRHGHSIAIVGLVLLLANPWAWFSISFDFHVELVAVIFEMLAAYDLAHERRRAWLWAALTLLCGSGEATWVAGLGLAAIVAGQRWRRSGLALLALGVAWVGGVIVIHGDAGGNVLAIYGYLARARPLHHLTIAGLVVGIVTHPGRALSALFRHRIDIWANLAPAGLLGILNPWALGLSLPVLLQNELLPGQNLFSSPLFQSVLLYVIVPVGTVLVLLRLHGRWPRLTVGLGAVIAANAMVWSAIWAPYIPERWLRVSAPSARILARADAMIPSSAEVIASNGVAGRFSDRALLYPVLSPSQVIPLQARDTWWIIAPRAGVEPDPALDESALIAELAGPLHAKLVMQGQGVWVFQWSPPSGRRALTVPRLPTSIPGWLYAGREGRPLLDGPSSTWRLGSDGDAGYVLAGDYWRVRPGRYQATVTMSSTARADVEVWNSTGHVLLARRVIPATNGQVKVAIPVVADRVYPHSVFDGWGPFQGGFPGPPHDDQLEIRVWEAGAGGLVEVRQIQMRPAGSRWAKRAPEILGASAGDGVGGTSVGPQAVDTNNLREGAG